MKEKHLFYADSASIAQGVLSEEESRHALKALRVKPGEVIWLTDGNGTFHEARVTETDKRNCWFQTERTLPDTPRWKGRIRIAVAPTKNADRTEWLLEKATEIGVDEFILLKCAHAERKSVNRERLERIAISAMKQSYKASKPVITEMTAFDDFLQMLAPDTQRLIAHCHEADDKDPDSFDLTPAASVFLGDIVEPDADTVVAIGPEGDFSPEEVEKALKNGFRAVSLGESRLRTETAALVAVHTMSLIKRRH